MPIHHALYVVPDLEVAKKFYLTALGPLGYEEVRSFPGFAVGLGVNGAADFWLGTGASSSGGPNKLPTNSFHIAFKAESKEIVDKFHEEALKAGATDNGAPGPREHYAPTYYGAFVIDPFGNNIEVVNL